jgi:uncharacterized protein (DUF2062 family)
MKKFHWNPHRWLHEHSLKLLAIRDTPEAIAGGVAIGIFFGFTPLFGLKTLSAIFFAWLTGSNILAAVIAGALHDVILPFMPAIYLWEYDLGYWLLNHAWPERVNLRAPLQTWRSWTTFITVGKPMLLGSAVCGAPVAAVAFLITRRIMARHQRKKQAQAAPPIEPGANPS